MRWSRTFLPTMKDTPAEAQIASHRYMLRAGMVRQNAAGIYTWLPLGLKVLTKIADIVRDEPITIQGWTPSNYNDERFGRMTLSEALARRVARRISGI